MSTDSSSLSIRLPLEILYDIVDLLVHDIKQDIHSIRACSLVCQAFVPQCQAALFSTLDIFVDERRTQGDKFPNKQTRNLSEILQYKPDLAAHFHTLRWGVSRLTVNPTPGFLPVLEHIQGRNKIRTLQVYSKRTKQQYLSDARLLGLVIAPFITRLEVLNVHLYDPPGFFTTCRKLKELQVDGLSESLSGTWSAIIATNQTFWPRLQLYDEKMSDSHNTFNLTKVVDLSKLRVLHIYSGVSDKSQYLQSLFSVCAVTIQELHIKKKENGSCRLPLFLDFAFFPSLRILDIDMNNRYPLPDLGLKDPFLELDQVLGTIPTENKIEVLSLNFFFDVKATSELETYFDLRWQVLTSQVPRIASGKPLQVLLHIIYHPSPIDIMNEKFGLICKSAFQRLVVEKSLIPPPSHISWGITQNVY